MAEEAAVFGGMAVRQRGRAVIVMAFGAEFFGCLLACDFMKPFVVFVMGQARGGFARGEPEKQENAYAKDDENKVIEQNVFFALGGFSQFIILLAEISYATHLAPARC
jgi:hypothetical protein